MRALAIKAIVAYQRYVSPYKGFRCAYRAHTGRASCSALGLRLIRRYGLRKGVLLLRRRLKLCGIVHRRFAAAAPAVPRLQRGICDAGCDLPFDLDCDLPNPKRCLAVSDVLSCSDACSCDWPSRKRKSDRRERQVYIPPYTPPTPSARYPR